MVRIADWSSASSAWPTMSEPSNSCARLGQDARAIERDIAVADRPPHGVPPSGGSRSAKSGWPLYQPTNSAEPTTPGKILAGNAELAVVRRAGGEDHRVVELEQLGDRDVAADGDIADEVDAGAFGDLVVALADRLQRLVVGRDAEADQAVGHGIAVEDVDARLLAIGLLQRLGGVEARRTRTDHREMPHAASRLASVAKL